MKKRIFTCVFCLLMLSNSSFSQEIKKCQCVGYINTSTAKKFEIRVALLTEPFEIPCIDNPRAANYPNGGFDGNIPNEGYRGDIDIQIFEHFYKNEKANLNLIKQLNRLDYTIDFYIFNPSVSVDKIHSSLDSYLILKKHDKVVWVPRMTYKPLKYSGEELFSRLRKKSQYMKNEISDF